MQPKWPVKQLDPKWIYFITLLNRDPFCLIKYNIREPYQVPIINFIYCPCNSSLRSGNYGLPENVREREVKASVFRKTWPWKIDNHSQNISRLFCAMIQLIEFYNDFPLDTKFLFEAIHSTTNFINYNQPSMTYPCIINFNWRGILLVRFLFLPPSMVLRLHALHYMLLSWNQLVRPISNDIYFEEINILC